MSRVQEDTKIHCYLLRLLYRCCLRRRNLATDENGRSAVSQGNGSVVRGTLSAMRRRVIDQAVASIRQNWVSIGICLAESAGYSQY